VTVEEDIPIKFRKKPVQKVAVRPKSVRSEDSFQVGSFKKKKTADEKPKKVVEVEEEENPNDIYQRLPDKFSMKKLLTPAFSGEPRHVLFQITMKTMSNFYFKMNEAFINPTFDDGQNMEDSSFMLEEVHFSPYHQLE